MSISTPAKITSHAKTREETPAHTVHDSLLTPSFLAMLLALLVIAAGDIATTDYILSQGGVELAPTSAAWQQALGLPWWSLVWLLLHGAICAIALVFWHVILLGERLYRPSSWLCALGRTFRALFLCAAFVWNAWHLFVVLHNALVILRIPAGVFY